jgi:hypothetical protein
MRRKFTREDDEALAATVKAMWPAVWAQVAEAMNGKWTARQLRDRWNSFLNPQLNHEWTQEDDRRLLALHDELGNRWAAIAIRLRNRSNVSVRNRFRTLKTQGQLLPEPVQAEGSDGEEEMFEDWEESGS